MSDTSKRLLPVLALLAAAGCDSSSPTAATVRVQLTKAAEPTTAYALDGMTVRLQRTGGAELTAVTDSEGAAVIEVTELGEYRILSVDGVDVSGETTGAEGREYVKVSPLASPDPVVTHSFGGAGPTVAVPSLGAGYMVDAPVPPARKVTVRASANYSAPREGLTPISGESFAGRVILRNLSFGGDTGAAVVLPARTADAALHNRMILYAGFATTLSGAALYGGAPETSQEYDLSTFPLAGPIAFEAPGTGDWALGILGESAGRRARGTADPSRDFPAFGSASNELVRPYSTAGAGAGATYAFDYELQEFTPVP